MVGGASMVSTHWPATDHNNRIECSESLGFLLAASGGLYCPATKAAQQCQYRPLMQPALYSHYFFLPPVYKCLISPASGPPPTPRSATSVMARSFTSQTRSLLSSALKSNASAELSDTGGLMMRALHDEGCEPPEDDFGGGFEAPPGSRRRPRRRSRSSGLWDIPCLILTAPTPNDVSIRCVIDLSFCTLPSQWQHWVRPLQ